MAAASDQGGEEEVDGEAGMAADAELEAAKGVAELGAPGSPSPPGRGGFGQNGSGRFGSRSSVPRAGVRGVHSA